MSPLRAVIFDVDGTLVDSEQEGHRVAFNQAFEQLRLPDRWTRDQYRDLLKVAGGRQRLVHHLLSQGRDEDHAEHLATRLHQEKTRIFRELVGAGRVPLRPGVGRLVEDLRSAGVRLFVATTGSREWVAPLLEGHFGGDVFEHVVTGSEVPVLKPAPDVYLRVLELSGCEAPEVVAVEDSLNGLRAAHAAGIACLVVRNAESRGDFTDAELVCDGFGPEARYLSGAAGPAAVAGGCVGVETLRAVARLAAEGARR